MTTSQIPDQLDLLLGFVTPDYIDRVCGPNRNSRWKNDGRQYNRDTILTFLQRAVADLRAAHAIADVQEPEKCRCGIRTAEECEEEWGPGCDLGNNAEFVTVEHLTEEALAQTREKLGRGELPVQGARYALDADEQRIVKKAIFASAKVLGKDEDAAARNQEAGWYPNITEKHFDLAVARAVNRVRPPQEVIDAIEEVVDWLDYEVSGADKVMRDIRTLRDKWLRFCGQQLATHNPGDQNDH